MRGKVFVNKILLDFNKYKSYPSHNFYESKIQPRLHISKI